MMRNGFVMAVCWFATACGAGGATPNEAGADADAQSADAIALDVAADATQSSPLAGVQVLFPPPSGSDHAAVQTYLMTNKAVAGAVIAVDWSDFDLGGGNYDFSIPDALIAPWESAGKRVHLVLQNTPYGGGQCPATGSGSHGTSGIGNCSTPPWVWTTLGSSGWVTCSSPTGSQQAPNFLSPLFISAYQAAIKALVDHYASHPAVGYIRVGLGKGGEINIPTGWNDTTSACGKAYITAWKYSVGTDATSTWNAYLQSMVEFEGSLNAPKQLMVSITPVQSTTGASANAVSDFLAPIATAHGIGFGNQGLQYSDTTSYPACGGDWCNLFAAAKGKVPLELQTFGESCPAGVNQCGTTTPPEKLSSATGTLPPIVPFAVSHDVTTLEIYYQDWLIAYDPSNANYATYGASYRSVLEAAASAL